MAYIYSVNSSEKKGEIKLPCKKGLLIADGGLSGDAHAGDGHRQLSLLALEDISDMSALLGERLEPGVFAENITTSGISLHTLPVGTRLTLGECEIEITQIGKECHSGCDIFKKVGKCVMPTRGVFARVLTGGSVSNGDSISVIQVT